MTAIKDLKSDVWDEKAGLLTQPTSFSRPLGGFQDRHDGHKVGDCTTIGMEVPTLEVLLWASQNNWASSEVCAARSHRSCCEGEAVHGRVNTMADDGLCMPERVWRSKVGKIHTYAEWRSRTCFPSSRFPNTASFGQTAGILKSKG